MHENGPRVAEIYKATTVKPPKAEGLGRTMDDHTIKHLTLIEAIITRLAQNSFSYKGWAITLVAAIFALAAKEVNPSYLLIALIPTLAFWGLDAYYLRQERLFRKLYDAVRSSGTAVSPFSMDTSSYNNQVATWWSTCWSKTIWWLYGPMAMVVLVVTGIAAGRG
jgi:hypothetical protein